MALNIDNVNPYRIFIIQEVNKQWLTPGLPVSIGAILRQNNNYPKTSPAYLWFDLLEFRFVPASVDWYGSSPYSMSGLLRPLNALPPKDPWPKGLTPFLISYFGNSAKKKLAELATPEALFQWMQSCPLEVLGHLGCYCPPTRSEEEIAKAREALKPKETPPPTVEYQPVTEAPKRKKALMTENGVTDSWLEEATTTRTAPATPPGAEALLAATGIDIDPIIDAIDAATPNEAPRQ